MVYDISVAVDTTTANPVMATSKLQPGFWTSQVRMMGWRGNFGGTGTARNSGSRPYYEGDGTSDNPGASVLQSIARFQEVGSGVFNAFAYNSSTGNPWTDPTQDCPASDTTTYPYYGFHVWNGGVSPGTGAIPFVDGDGWWWPPTGATGVETSNPWATDDQHIMMLRCLMPKSQIKAAMRAAPAWMSAAWNGSTTSGGTANISNSTEPNKVNGNPPLFMKVVASGTAATSIGWSGWFSTGVSAGASGGTFKSAGTGQWGTGTATIGLSNGDSLILAPGTANEETVTLASLNTSTGVFTITGTFANAHVANVLAFKYCGTRIIASFFGGNTCSSGLAGSGYSPGTGNVWTFFDCMARLCRRFAERYPFIQDYLPWGEPGNTNKAAVSSTNDTGAWGQTDNVWWADDGSGHTLQASPAWTPSGRNNIVPATILYNKVYAALKSVPGRNYSTFPLTFGGPYHSCSAPTNSTTLAASDDGVFTVFFTNAVALDTIIFDGFSPANTGSTAPASGPVTGLAVADNATAGTLPGIQAVLAKATAFGFGALPLYQAETYFDSNLAKLNYASPSVGPAATNWFTSDVQATAIASLLYYSLMAGVSFVARWQAQGDTSTSYNGYADTAYGSTYNVESFVSTAKNSDAFTTGLTSSVLGKPFPAHAVQKSFVDNFSAGVGLNSVAVTDASATSGKQLLVVSSDTAVMLINQYNVTKNVGVSVNGGTPITVLMAAYTITTIPISVGGGGGGGGTSTRIQHYTNRLGDILNPQQGIGITLQLVTPNNIVATNQENIRIRPGQATQKTTITQSDGTYDIAGDYLGDLTPDGCMYLLDEGGYKTLLPIRAYSPGAVDVGTLYPVPSVDNSLLMSITLGIIDSTADQNGTVAIGISKRVQKADGSFIRPDNPKIFGPSLTGVITLNMYPTDLLTPNDSVYQLIWDNGTTDSFTVPDHPTGWQGTWSAITTYHVHTGIQTDPSDVVIRNGLLYRCAVDNTNQDPATTTGFWIPFPGEPIEWHITLGASVGDIIATPANLSLSSAFANVSGDPINPALNLDDQLIDMVSRIAAAPRGQLGYVQATTSFTSTSLSLVDVTSMNLTVVATARKLKVTFYCGLVDHSVDTDAVNIVIIDTTGSAQVAKATVYSAAASGGSPVMMSAIVTPGAGSRTYKVQTDAGSAGTATLTASSTEPMYMLIEEI